MILHTTSLGRHLAALERASLVIAVWNGPDVDSGTAWEMGFAYSRQVPIIGVH